MPKLAGEDRRLTRVSKICLALPEAVRQDMGQHASFQIRKRIFAYFLNDHHGDGIVSIACKALRGENGALAAAQPDRFYLPAYIGPRGWVALRLDVGETDWEEVGDLIKVSYKQIAPRKLAVAVKLGD
jgi:phosphoribosylglycinamide formyltransferase-1